MTQKRRGNHPKRNFDRIKSRLFMVKRTDTEFMLRGMRAASAPNFLELIKLLRAYKIFSLTQDEISRIRKQKHSVNTFLHVSVKLQDAYSK